MPQQIVQQPDGRWCVFSTVVDAIIVYDATEDELVDYFAEQAAEDARRDVRRRIEQAKTRSRPNESMLLTYDEALREHERAHGPLRAAQST